MTDAPTPGGVRFDFHGARVLVTGGTRGIGLAIAGAFADHGGDVIVTGTRGDVGDYDDDLSAFDFRSLDVTSPDSITALGSSLAADGKGLSILVNNAGANMPGGASEFDPAVFEESVRINLGGSFRMCQACLPLLAAHPGNAAVLNVASMASFFGIPFIPGYGAAKAGVVQMTKSLAVAWAPQGIRVNAVAPGFVRTRMTAGFIDHEAMSRPHLARTPMARWGDPSDIAPAALFLCSAGATFITGQTLPIDGGYSIA